MENHKEKIINNVNANFQKEDSEWKSNFEISKDSFDKSTADAVVKKIIQKNKKRGKWHPDNLSEK